VPLSLWLAADCGILRARPGPLDVQATVLLAIAAATALALRYNP
jgi:hypothetical protein